MGIMVKLRQMSAEEPEPPHLSWDCSPGSSGWKRLQDERQRMYVYSSRFERVSMEQWPAGAARSSSSTGASAIPWGSTASGAGAATPARGRPSSARRAPRAATCTSRRVTSAAQRWAPTRTSRATIEGEVRGCAKQLATKIQSGLEQDRLVVDVA